MQHNVATCMYIITGQYNYIQVLDVYEGILKIKLLLLFTQVVTVNIS